MMSQKTVLGVNEQVIAQAELEKDIKKQADLIAPEKDSIHSQIQSFLSVENPNVATPWGNDREAVTKCHVLHLSSVQAFGVGTLP